MRRLILMRHAKSDWNHAGQRDHDRPLSPRGMASARAVGDWLRDHAYLPDEVLCSSAARTRATLLGLRLPADVPVTLTRALYLAEAQEMLDVLHEATAPCVLMLGHNAGISEMAQRLVKLPLPHPCFDRYPTCATLVVDFDVDDWDEVAWGGGRPQAFVVPRDLMEDQ